MQRNKCANCEDYKSGRMDGYICENECPFDENGNLKEQ